MHLDGVARMRANENGSDLVCDVGFWDAARLVEHDNRTTKQMVRSLNAHQQLVDFQLNAGQSLADADTPETHDGVNVASESERESVPFPRLIEERCALDSDNVATILR
jgi:hypothetical protein